MTVLKVVRPDASLDSATRPLAIGYRIKKRFSEGHNHMDSISAAGDPTALKLGELKHTVSVLRLMRLIC